jgi:hypothetical protein
MHPQSALPFVVLSWFAAASLSLPPLALSQPGFWQSLGGPEGGVVQCFTTDAQGHILAGTYFGGLYRTVDRGATWSHLAETSWDTRAILAAPGGGVLFAGAANSGVWSSTDAGTTWNRPANILNGRTVTALAFTRAGHLIAGCASTASQSVYKSTDNGATFYQVSALVLSANGLAPEKGDTLFCAGDRFGVIITTDAGQTWTRINPSSSNFDGLGVASNSTYLYLVGRRNPSTNPDTSFIYRRRHTSGVWELMRVHPGTVLRTVSTLGDTIMVAGGLSVLISFDGGQTWFDRSNAGTSAGGTSRKAAISSYVAADIQLLGTAGRSVALSRDFALSWSQSSRGLLNTHIVAGTSIGSSRALVSAQFDGLFLVDGTTMTRTGAGLPESDVVTVLAASGAAVYAGTVNNGLFRSTDGGANFTQALYGLNASGVVTITTRRGDTVRAGGRGEYLHTSTDRGSSWTSNRLPAGVTTNITSIKETGDGMVYVGTGAFGGSGAGNGVYRTSDGGISWGQRGLQFTAVVSLDLHDDSLMLAGTGLAQVYEGRTSSTQWTLTPQLPLGTTLRFAHFYKYATSPLKEVAGLGTGWYQRDASTEPAWWRQVFPPFEPAASWRTPPSSLRNSPAAPGGLDAGTYGGGVYRSTGPLTWVRSGPEAGPEVFRLEQNYPNPFNPTTTIRLTIRKSGRVSLRIYDVLGAEVDAPLSEVELREGDHAVRWDGAGRASGVYLYRLEFDGAPIATRLMLLVK